MNVISMSVGLLGANCYILYDDNKEAVVIDPGGNGEDILAKIQQKELVLRYIIITHGHFDHIDAVKLIKERTGAIIAIHKLDAENLIDANKNLSSSMGVESVQVNADMLLDRGDVIRLGNIQCKIVHTPGHSKGGVCVLVPGAVFTGDTLFQGSVGRTDFWDGDSRQLLRSIKEHLLVLDDETIVYPGHGSKTTIGTERSANPFLEGLV